jgi:hypothetical protein
LNLKQITELASISDSIKCRRDVWESDMYVVVEVAGERMRISLGFQGPYEVTAKDREASDWKMLSIDPN